MIDWYLLEMRLRSTFDRKYRRINKRVDLTSATYNLGLEDQPAEGAFMRDCWKSVCDATDAQWDYENRFWTIRLFNRKTKTGDIRRIG